MSPRILYQMRVCGHPFCCHCGVAEAFRLGPLWRKLSSWKYVTGSNIRSPPSFCFQILQGAYLSIVFSTIEHYTITGPKEWEVEAETSETLSQNRILSLKLICLKWFILVTVRECNLGNMDDTKENQSLQQIHPIALIFLVPCFLGVVVFSIVLLLLRVTSFICKFYLFLLALSKCSLGLRLQQWFSSQLSPANT